jgi:hypothetical protein
MAQRRKPGRDDDDLSDVKALAAKARETGGPALKPNPAELSGVRPRRDSVIGMRLTPPPRSTGSDMPNWLWGVLGCLSVLLVGFAALFVLGRAGKLGPLLGEAAAMVGAPAAPAAAPASVPAPTPPPAAQAGATVKEIEAPAAAAPAEHARPEHHAHVAEPAPAEPAAPVVAAADPPPAADPTPPAPAAEAPADNNGNGPADEPAARRPGRATKAKAAKEGEAATAADDGAGSDSPEAKRAARAAAPAAKAPAADDSDDDQSLPGQDDVERALDALAPRVRGCFVKYQIKGTARVRLVATPAGKAESINVTGDFEDTPTGLCVESILSEAKLPAFKGPPLKLSQSYQLR